ncbi:MAG: leucyl aminopeptidase [Pseudomonadota bacterium]|nr:leucyl aminopeptidase [Pseudomonadota bacterium]
MKKYLTLNFDYISPKNIKGLKAKTLILGTYEGGKLNQFMQELSSASNGVLKKILDRKDITGRPGDGLYIPSLTNIRAERLYLVGCGKKGKKLSKEEVHKIFNRFIAYAISSKEEACTFIIPNLKVEKEDDDWLLQQLGMLAENNMYIYNPKLGKKNVTPNKLKRITVSYDSRKKTTTLKRSLKNGQIIGKGSNAAKDLANLPGNICTPSYIAKASRQVARKYSSLSCKVLGEKEMKKLGMDCLLSVGAGSVQESKLICLSYKGSKTKKRPYILVGKGITFDTGGISLKPGGAMDEMKFDMCGAASVFGTLQVVAELKLPINVIGIIASAENMPGSKATKPGDVVKTMSGLTVEVLNTDAEGRLVLADALTYSKRFNPKTVIDIATLTGACIIALGKSTTGLMSNDDKLASEILKAGKTASDLAWQLPIWDIYKKDLDSNFADIANIGGRAGTITAACFLSRFTEDLSWAHLDIAGTAWYQGKAKGASGRPVPLLSQYLINKS